MKKGFTLVELSIVLVIIGLLIGGILSAQSLMHTVKLNRGIKQLQQYEIMFNQYKNLYRYYPGDDPTPKGSCAFCGWAGNGNGMMGYTYAGWGTWGEQFMAWQDLKAVGFLRTDANFSSTGSYSPSVVVDANTPEWVGDIIPSFTYNKKVGIFPQAYFNPYDNVSVQDTYATQQPQCSTTFLLTSYTTGDQHWGGAMDGMTALAMDKKIDDGNAATGYLLATYTFSPAVAANGQKCFTEGDINGYSASDAKTYNVNSAPLACRVFYCFRN